MSSGWGSDFEDFSQYFPNSHSVTHKPPPGLHCGPSGRATLLRWLEKNYQLKSDKINENPGVQACKIWQETQGLQDVTMRSLVDFLKILGQKKNLVYQNLFEKYLKRKLLNKIEKSTLSSEEFERIIARPLQMFQVLPMHEIISKLLDKVDVIPPSLITVIIADTPTAHTFYQQCSLKVKRQIWVHKPHLFFDEIRQICLKIIKILHTETSDLNKWVFETKNTSFYEGGSGLMSEMKTLIETIGCEIVLYNMCIYYLKQQFMVSLLPHKHTYITPLTPPLQPSYIRQWSSVFTSISYHKDKEDLPSQNYYQTSPSSVSTASFTPSHTHTHTHPHTSVYTHSHGDIQSSTPSHIRTHGDIHTNTPSYTDTHTNIPLHKDTLTNTSSNTNTQTDIPSHRDTHTNTDMNTSKDLNTFIETDISTQTYLSSNTHTSTQSSVCTKGKEGLQDTQTFTQSNLTSFTQKQAILDNITDAHSSTINNTSTHTNTHNYTHTPIHTNTLNTSSTLLSTTHPLYTSLLSSHNNIRTNIQPDTHIDTHTHPHTNTHTSQHIDRHADIDTDINTNTHTNLHTDTHTNTEMAVKADVSSYPTETSSNTHMTVHTQLETPVNTQERTLTNTNKHTNTYAQTNTITQTQPTNEPININKQGFSNTETHTNSFPSQANTSSSHTIPSSSHINMSSLPTNPSSLETNMSLHKNTSSNTNISAHTYTSSHIHTSPHTSMSSHTRMFSQTSTSLYTNTPSHTITCSEGLSIEVDRVISGNLREGIEGIMSNRLDTKTQIHTHKQAYNTHEHEGIGCEWYWSSLRCLFAIFYKEINSLTDIEMRKLDPSWTSISYILTLNKNTTQPYKPSYKQISSVLPVKNSEGLCEVTFLLFNPLFLCVVIRAICLFISDTHFNTLYEMDEYRLWTSLASIGLSAPHVCLTKYILERVCILPSSSSQSVSQSGGLQYDSKGKMKESKCVFGVGTGVIEGVYRGEEGNKKGDMGSSKVVGTGTQISTENEDILTHINNTYSDTRKGFKRIRLKSTESSNTLQTTPQTHIHDTEILHTTTSQQQTYPDLLFPHNNLLPSHISQPENQHTTVHTHSQHQHINTNYQTTPPLQHKNTLQKTAISTTKTNSSDTNPQATVHTHKHKTHKSEFHTPNITYTLPNQTKINTNNTTHNITHNTAHNTTQMTPHKTHNTQCTSQRNTHATNTTIHLNNPSIINNNTSSTPSINHSKGVTSTKQKRGLEYINDKEEEKEENQKKSNLLSIHKNVYEGVNNMNEGIQWNEMDFQKQSENSCSSLSGGENIASMKNKEDVQLNKLNNNQGGSINNNNNSSMGNSSFGFSGGTSQCRSINNNNNALGNSSLGFSEGNNNMESSNSMNESCNNVGSSSQVINTPLGSTPIQGGVSIFGFSVPSNVNSGSLMVSQPRWMSYFVCEGDINTHTQTRLRSIIWSLVLYNCMTREDYMNLFEDLPNKPQITTSTMLSLVIPCMSIKPLKHLSEQFKEYFVASDISQATQSNTQTDIPYTTQTPQKTFQKLYQLAKLATETLHNHISKTFKPKFFNDTQNNIINNTTNTTTNNSTNIPTNNPINNTTTTTATNTTNNTTSNTVHSTTINIAHSTTHNTAHNKTLKTKAIIQTPQELQEIIQKCKNSSFEKSQEVDKLINLATEIFTNISSYAYFENSLFVLIMLKLICIASVKGKTALLFPLIKLFEKHWINISDDLSNRWIFDFGIKTLTHLFQTDTSHYKSLRFPTLDKAFFSSLESKSNCSSWTITQLQNLQRLSQQ